jgi:uncharacterized membrane protein/predicted small secreted protein
MLHLLVALLAALALALSGCGYNTFQSTDEQIKASWSEMLNPYQRRADLIPNIVATAVEIVADRGIHAKAGAEAWSVISRGMETRFGAGDFGRGAAEGVEAVTLLVTRHFALTPGDRNELPDAPILL